MEDATSPKQGNTLWSQIPSTAQPVQKEKWGENIALHFVLYVRDRNRESHTTIMLFGGFLALYSTSSGRSLKALGHSKLVMSQILSVTIRARKGAICPGVRGKSKALKWKKVGGDMRKPIWYQKASLWWNSNKSKWKLHQCYSCSWSLLFKRYWQESISCQLRVLLLFKCCFKECT